MNTSLRLTLITLTLLTTIYSASSRAAAQTAGLSLSPELVEIIIAPNKKVIQAFSLTNLGEPNQFTVSLRSVEPSGTDGHATISPDPLDPASIPIVASLSHNEPFHLGSSESQQLTLTVEGASSDVPEDIYFALVITTAPPPGTTATALPGISSLVFVTLAPTDSYPLNLEIDNFDLPLVHDNLTPLPMQPTVTNLAPVMMRPIGSLEIFSPRNHQNQKFNLFPHLVLAQSSRTLQAATLENCLQSESDCQPQPLIWEPSLLQVGPYRFRLTLTTQGGTKITEVERTVWLLPLKTIIILSIVLLICFIYKLRSREKNQKPTP